MVSSQWSVTVSSDKVRNTNMRMRKKKNGEARIAACEEYLIRSADDEKLAGMLPCELEIGCGKGRFICETGKLNPDKKYIAVELMTDALITALELAKSEDVQNVKFINANAKDLALWFKKGDISVIYLNFSDPWPKAKHAKRRLTFRSFLEVYKSILADDGKICFKTDNRALFDFSLEEFRECGWRLDKVTYDLHNSEWNEGNVMTEYEKAFSEKGVPINRLEAYIK